MPYLAESARRPFERSTERTWTGETLASAGDGYMAEAGLMEC